MNNSRVIKRTPLSQEILAKIAKIDEFKGHWQGGGRLSPHILKRLKAFVIITSTGASTRIEGSKMTDKEIARFLRGLQTHPPKNRDQEEVAGYADLIGRILDNWKTIKLTEGWIKQLHEILLQFSEKDKAHKGRYKDSDNTVVMINEKGEQIVLFAPTPPFLVEAEMQAAIEWTNKELEKEDMHPLLVIGNFIFEFLAIHPFFDGNGRASRALTNLLLLQAGYHYIPYVSLEGIIERTRAEYYLALRATQKNHKTDHEDITPWVNYFLSTLIEQAEGVRRLIEEDVPEKVLSEKQKQILDLFADNKTLGVSEVGALLGGKMRRETVKQVLYRLVKLNLLERFGQARSTRYRRNDSNNRTNE